MGHLSKYSVVIDSLNALLSLQKRERMQVGRGAIARMSTLHLQIVGSIDQSAHRKHRWCRSLACSRLHATNARVLAADLPDGDVIPSRPILEVGRPERRRVGLIRID